jgi:hypothetical protein
MTIQCFSAFGKAPEQLCFSRVLADIVAKCHEEQLEDSVQSYIKVGNHHPSIDLVPCAVWLVSFPVCLKREVLTFAEWCPSESNQEFPLAEFHLLALMGYTYCLNVYMYKYCVMGK